MIFDKHTYQVRFNEKYKNVFISNNFLRLWGLDKIKLYKQNENCMNKTNNV